MFIETIPNNGKPYLRLVQAYRKPNRDGKMVSSKRILLNIGPLDHFDDGKPDYLERLRQSFRNGDPLIPELKPYCTKEPPVIVNKKVPFLSEKIPHRFFYRWWGHRGAVCVGQRPQMR